MDNHGRKSSGRSSSRRLIFDRRYGWVFDQWKDPSEEALAGGRGMFCILPIAKGLLSRVSQSINFGARTAVTIIEKPELLSPKALQEGLNDQLHKLAASIKKSELQLFGFTEDSQTPAPTNVLQLDGSVNRENC